MGFTSNWKLVIAAILLPMFCSGQFKAKTTTIGIGWANNSVNTVVFRKNSLVTFKGVQYTAFYNQDQFVVLGKRASSSKQWDLKQTAFKGDATDAHKSISIMIDGAGYLHIAWGQHNNELNYAISIAPASLTLGNRQHMIGTKEQKVSYPEFYKLANGDLLFLYRDGGSGNGNLMLNRYSITTKQWTRIQDGLIDGEGKRNAYWQTAINNLGEIELSWVWRENPDVGSNHDMCYASSKDGGVTWQRSTGEIYTLPITAASAEYACKIPQHSELINQTSMFADDEGNAYIATYWRDSGQVVPQYHLVYHTGSGWKVQSLMFRKAAFSLSGGGTKSIPVSRPQIIAWKSNNKQSAAIIFRDVERQEKVSIAVNQNINTNNWKLSDLTTYPVGAWEPSYDTELWKNKKILNLFIQKTVQVDGEGKADNAPEKVQVLEWNPLLN